MERLETAAPFAEEVASYLKRKGRLDVILHRVDNHLWVTLAARAARPILARTVAQAGGRIYRDWPTVLVPGQKVTINRLVRQLPRFFTTFYPQATDKPVYIYSSWVKYHQKEPTVIIKPQVKISEPIIAP